MAPGKLAHMVQRTIIRRLDDIDGSDADETVRFAIDGGVYEVDLNREHADELREALARYQRAGRRVARWRLRESQVTQAQVGRVAARRDPAQMAAIRSWAAENNWPVSPHGRIPQSVIDAWEEAHSAQPRSA